MKICQELARKIASENINESIEKSTTNFDTKVKPITFNTDELVLLKEHNFLHSIKKQAKTFKGQLRKTKVHENDTILIKKKEKC
jgi:hypothetical protein